MNYTSNQFFPLISSSFASQGLPVWYGLAICRQESNFNPNVTNMGPGDKERGGSYGLFQMSYQTAKGLGFTGQPGDLHDPKTNAQLAAKLCKEAYSRFPNLQDVAAMYNSGKPFAKAPIITKSSYVPNVIKYAEEARAQVLNDPSCPDSL